MGKSVDWLSSVSVLFAALVITGCGAGTDTGEEVSDFTSIIDNDGADPWILQTESYFYYTKTTGNNLTLWRAENLSLVATGEKKIIWLVYSASGSWDNDYALGLMTLDVADDPLEKANWQKEPEPIFQQTNTVYGPGHNGFAKSKDGSEDWLIYHAARWDHSGWDRSIRLQKFGWDQEDKVLLEAPLDEWHV